MPGLFRLVNDTPNLRPRYNVAPTDGLPIVRRDKAGNREVVMLWGTDPIMGGRSENRVQHHQRSR